MLHDALSPLQSPLLFLVGDRRRDVIHRRLTAAHIALEERVVYESSTDSSFQDKLEGALVEKDSIDWIVFFSPTGADLAIHHILRLENPPKVATIGPTTSDFLINSYDIMPQAVAASPEPSSLLHAIREYEGVFNDA
jgi:uroporphyrinogen-III synthase